MALDHYVSQVYLKNFNSPVHGRLNAVRKTDLKVFSPRAQDVCRIEEGNTNMYLRYPRAIEDFLSEIEPKYNSVLTRLRSSAIDDECVFVVAGFVAYILVCSPGGMRLRAAPMKPILTEMARRLDRLGRIPKAPESLGGESMTDLLESGAVNIEIDEKYPQALGIGAIHEHILRFGNFGWDILFNPFPELSFFTSDYPIAIEDAEARFIMNKIVPLAPDLAVRIRPDRKPLPETKDFSFPNFRSAFTTLRRSAIGEINAKIVRCAETTVFYRDEDQATVDFVKRHSNYRIESRTERIADGERLILMAAERIARIDEGGNSGRAPSKEGRETMVLPAPNIGHVPAAVFPVAKPAARATRGGQT